MTRPPDPGFDVRISDWLEADPNLAPPDLMRTVESALPSIPQRRVIHLPWRFPPMSTFAKLAVAAVAVIAIGAVGIFALQPRGVPAVGAPSASPSPSPALSPSPAASMPPPLSESFTSPSNGISIGYPAGWTTQPATEPWTTTGWPSFPQSTGDSLYDPTLRDHLFISLASQPLAGKDGGQWASDALAADGCVPSSPVTIDGATGLVGDDCEAAAVAIDGRGYLIAFYASGDEAWLEDAYTRTWFEQLLATVDLRPEDAASSAPSSAAASMPPPLSGTFTSSINGISLSYPAGWSEKPATEPWTTEGQPVFSDPNVDILHDPVLGDHLFVGVASRALAGTAGDQWAADFQASSGCGPTMPITVDGASGLLSEGGCLIAAVTSGGRGYFVWLHPSSEQSWLGQVYDRAWFEQLLATVDLRPEDAVSESPSP